MGGGLVWCGGGSRSGGVMEVGVFIYGLWWWWGSRGDGVMSRVKESGGWGF